MIFLKRTALLGAAVLVAATSALADETKIRQEIKKKLPGIEARSVTKTPFPGLYEVVAGNQLFYTDEKVNYLMVGSLIDVKSQTNLTEQRVRSIFRVNFAALPFDTAIKVVKGNGKRKLAIFSDPDCPFCKKLEQELATISDVTLYTFLFPVDSLHPEAAAKAKAVWCAPDRAKAWDDLMLKGTVPQAGNCETPIAKTAELAKKLNINGTPTLIFEDGRMVPGLVPAAQLDKLLNAALTK